MAQTKICYKCGKVMKEGSRYYTVRFESYLVNGDPYQWLSRLSYDSCPECLAKFNDFTRYNLPYIQEVFFDIPYTTVKWNDNTTTTVKCSDEDIFSKEIGLSVAITKKYFEQKNSTHPWMVFDAMIKQSNDRTEKTDAEKAYKLTKKQKHIGTVENESINELDLLKKKIRSKFDGSRFSFSDRLTILKLISSARNRINQFQKENDYLLYENERLRKEKENLENKIHNQRKELNNLQN